VAERETSNERTRVPAMILAIEIILLTAFCVIAGPAHIFLRNIIYSLGWLMVSIIRSPIFLRVVPRKMFVAVVAPIALRYADFCGRIDEK
jgi:hypothetical protein